MRKGSGLPCVVEGSVETRTVPIKYCKCKAAHKNSSAHRIRRGLCTNLRRAENRSKYSTNTSCFQINWLAIYIYIYSTVPRALWINNFTIFAFGSPLCYMAAVKLKKLLQNSPSFYQTIPERSPSHPCMGQWLSPTEMTETVRLSCAVGTLSCPSCHGVSASPSLCQFVGLERGVSSDQSPTVCNKKLYELPVSIIQQRLRFYQRFFRNAGLLRCDVLLVNSCISFE